MIPQLSADIRDILHAVRNVAVDFLAIVPSPPQWIFQLHTFSTGERARVRGEGTWKTLPLNVPLSAPREV